MLIPSIDLKGGKIVQLVQGDALALESTDVDGWIERFRGFPAVQLIDLDAALALGNNDALVKRIAAFPVAEIEAHEPTLEDYFFSLYGVREASREEDTR
jgi:phosphoribosylformimino-5-aminoimidazole carboxamide ribotide isomerase